ncbi:MAG TPA: hypothetical protein VIU35_18755 [Chitinophagaceae bacterium]
MKQIFLFILFFSIGFLSNAQKIDSIFFHLYTDSLKKGTHNYINVDGKTSDGKWTPLTAKDITFTTSYGTFVGTELVLPDNPTVEKLTIKAILKSDPKLWKEITIWIKKKTDDELLPTSDEILKNKSQKNGKSKRDN